MRSLRLQCRYLDKYAFSAASLLAERLVSRFSQRFLCSEHSAYSCNHAWKNIGAFMLDGFPNYCILRIQ